jgi:hypothetical protein
MTNDMPNPTPSVIPEYREATNEELSMSLEFALCFNGRKRTHTADDYMARITAQRLIEHLRLSGYVILKKPPMAHHSTLMGRNNLG